MTKLMKRIFAVTLFAAPMLAAWPAQAQETAPDALAKRVTDEVIAVLRADKDIQAGKRKKRSIWGSQNRAFQFFALTRMAVGAPWRQASRATTKTDQRI